MALSRVTVLQIVTCYQQGLTPEEIADQHPHVNLAQIYAALAIQESRVLPITARTCGITVISCCRALQIPSQEKRNTAKQLKARYWFRRGSRGMDASLLSRLSFGYAGTIQGHRVGGRSTLLCHFRNSRGRRRRILPLDHAVEGNQGGAKAL